jgi:hypothetical protein
MECYVLLCVEAPVLWVGIPICVLHLHSFVPHLLPYA